VGGEEKVGARGLKERGAVKKKGPLNAMKKTPSKSPHLSFSYRLQGKKWGSAGGADYTGNINPARNSVKEVRERRVRGESRSIY